jgi:APA family basic amino acid/polyamine antiporter
MKPATARVPDSPSLDRRLGPLDGAIIVVSNVIGIGIFITPGFVASMLPDKTSILAVWAFGGALAFVGALAYAELAARRPLAGGEYVYLRESFGGLAAFLTGWTSFVAGFSGGIAAGAVGMTAYIDHFFPGAGSSQPITSWHIGWLTMSPSRQSVIAIATIIGLALVHARGLGPGRAVQNMLTVLKIGAIGTFVVVGLIMAMRLPMPSDGPSGPTPWSSWLIALVPVMFSYSGWNAAVYVAEEIRDPVRHVPRALAFGTMTVVALYLGLNALYLRVVPRQAFAGSTSVGEIAAEQLFGSAAASLFAAVAIVVILGSLSAMTMAGPRIYFAMARDGAFLRRAAQVHPRYRTPAIAILAQSGWSVLLVLSGTFDQLLTYTGFTVIMFSALAVFSLFFVRRTPADDVVFRAWGYPWAPAVFCLVSLAIVINTITQAPGVAFAGLGVISAGVPIYWLMRRRAAAEAHATH